MDKSTVALIALGIFALLALAFFAVFRGKGRVKINARELGSVELEGENPAPAAPRPGSAIIKDSASRSGGAVAEATGGGDASISGTVVEKDLRATTSAAPEKPSPK